MKSLSRTKDKHVGRHPVSEMSPAMQFFALAPWTRICESNEIDDEHPIWDLYNRSFTLSALELATLLDALDKASPTPKAREDLKAFLDQHYGSQVVLIGD